MSPRSPMSLSEGEVHSEDGEKVYRHAEFRQNTKVDSSARQSASSSRVPSYVSARESLMTDRNAHFNGYGRDIGRQRSRSPFRHDRSRSRSPYRADKEPTREKRRHQENHYGKGTSDQRRHKIYEDRPAQGGLGYNGSYRDLDRPVQPTRGLPYDDRIGRAPDKTRSAHATRDRDRSRSPYRATANTLSKGENGQSSRGNTSFSQRESTPHASIGNADTKMRTSRPDKHVSTSDREDKASEQTDETAEPEKKLSEAEFIEQRRKKREAIKKKHASLSANESLLRATLESNLPSTTTTPQNESNHGSEQASPPYSPKMPGSPLDSSSPASPAVDFGAMNDEDLVNPVQVSATNDEQGQSAADYDPNQDMNEDRPDHKRQDLQEAEAGRPKGGEPEANPAAPSKKTLNDYDMFAEDDIDMFAADDPADRGASKQAQTLHESMLDDWDYPDGHYRINNGELLDGNYAVEQQVGKGTFATVVRAVDLKSGNKVAIKIACQNDTMLKAGQKEMQFLERLNERDPNDKRHIIRLQGSFMHKGHLCLVFEGLHMDLREVLKKFGRDIGINLDAVKVYAYQMFQALLHLKSAEVLHADLKPDNILVNEKRTFIKVCDFGTATLQRDAELTPYLVSRFYRAPEVILGMDFDYAIDMWAIGCTLYELYAGRILFNGSDNNNMLRVIQECRGKLPNRLIKRAQMANKYFDENFTFYALERDKMTGNMVSRPTHFSQGVKGKDLKSRLSGNLSSMTPTMLKEHNVFVDLLDKCLQLDPEKRIKPKDALSHPLFVQPNATIKSKAPMPSTIFRPVAVQHPG